MITWNRLKENQAIFIGWQQVCLLLLTGLLLPFVSLFGQQRPRKTHQVKIISDNDSYTLTRKDGYYTNGIQFVYSWNNASDTTDLTLHTLELGQWMYNAENGSYLKREELDRPVTAFLFAAYHQTRFSERDDVFKWGVTGGVIGPPALGKEVQQGIHSILNMYEPKEWDYQLNTEIGLNASATWSPAIRTGRKHIGIKPVASASVGNTFTYAHIGTSLLLGKFNTNSHSVYWDANINGGTAESFFYIQPQIRLNAYNATVQGGLFRKDKGRYIGVLNPVMYVQHLGWMYSKKNFSLGISLVYESKQSKTQQYTQWYGHLSFGLAF